MIRKEIQNFQGSILKRQGRTDLSTFEGSKAWSEAILALIHQPYLSPLKWDNGLYLAARDHCKDAGPRGKVSHTGSDGTEVWDRLKRYGSGPHYMGENLSFGEHLSGDQYLLALYIDDGVMDRGHRNAL